MAYSPHILNKSHHEKLSLTQFVIHDAIVVLTVCLQLVNDVFRCALLLNLLTYESEQEVARRMVTILLRDVNHLVDHLRHLALVAVNVLEHLQRVAPTGRNDIDLTDLDVTTTLDSVVDHLLRVLVLLLELFLHPMCATVQACFLEINGHRQIQVG